MPLVREDATLTSYRFLNIRKRLKN